MSILIERGGEEWLRGLRSQERESVSTSLLLLSGVGPKVADCIALFSLDQLDCIPVDTHVYQIACNHYKANFPGLATKSVTARVYTQVGDFFRALFGEYAGWAHSFLFTADLKAFQDRVGVKKEKKGKKKGVVKKEKTEKRKGEEEEEKSDKVKIEKRKRKEEKGKKVKVEPPGSPSLPSLSSFSPSRIGSASKNMKRRKSLKWEAREREKKKINLKSE